MLSLLHPLWYVWIGDSWTFESQQFFEIGTNRGLTKDKDESNATQLQVRIRYSIVCHSLYHAPRHEGQPGCDSAIEATVHHTDAHDHAQTHKETAPSLLDHNS